MQCPRCRIENREGRRFCSECGAALARTCASCGFTNEPGDRFCGGCGAAVHPSSAAAQPSFTSPESYTPKHLAERIITSKAALEGERKQVTVLFADMKGSMELLGDRDPEEARRILDPVLERMMEAVHRYEGTVNQVMGDGIMALFGAPVAHEDHAVRACYAALWMQDAVKNYADEVRRSRGTPIHIRVGLNSGEVVVRAIGSDLHMDYTAVGQTTHLAARMEQAALPGSILITPATLALAQGLIDVKPLGPIAVRGLAQPIDVYELAGASAVRSRFQASAARGLTKFVGRAAEIEQLAEALELARAGRGQVVAVVGEPGVGKSRLLYELLHSHRVQDWLVVESGSVSYEKATAYVPVIELLRAYFAIERSDTVREIREKVGGKLLGPDGALDPFLPAFLWLLDVPVEDAGWERLDPPQRRQRTLEAVKRLVLRESQVQPVIVLIEDLHWVDSETQALLDALVESVATARVVVLVSYRPEYADGWASTTHYRQLRVDPLPPAGADELLDALLGADASVQPLKPLLRQRSEGTPFFLEESVRTLAEVKALAGERGAYRLLKAVEGIEVPPTVKAVLAARVDRLSPAEKTVLQAASVIGKDVPFVLLEAIAGISEDELRRHLHRLQSAEFLYETTLFPEAEFTFTHALTHEVTYDGVLHQRRRVWHAAIVDAIEQRYAGRLAEHVERLGHHAVRGEVWTKAAMYVRDAGIKAAARSLYPEAVGAFKDALAALAHLPEDRDRIEREFDLRLDLRTCLIGLGERQQVFDYLREAEALALKLDDRRRLAWVSMYMSAYMWATGGGAEQARTFAEHARGIALALEDFPLSVAANFYVGIACWASGDYGECERSQRQNVELLTGERADDRFGVTGFPAVMSRALLAQVLAERGAFDEALVMAADGVRIGEALDHAYSINMACWTLAYAFLVKGDVREAAEVCERGIAVAQQRNVASGVPWLTASLGFAYVLDGRAAAGLRLLRDAHETQRFAGLHSLFTIHLAEAYLMSGQVEAARSVGVEALMLTQQRGERGYQAWALRAAGEIAAAEDPIDLVTAERRYQESVRLAMELGMRPLVAHGHAGLGKLYRRTGKGDQTRDHLTTATAMYREMDMRFWLEKAEAEMRELS